MKKYKRKSDSTDSIYKDYKSEKIDSTELYKRLTALDESKIHLKEMSFIKDIVSELNAHPSLIDIHKGTWFSKLVERCRTMYLSYLGSTGESIQELSFSQYVKRMIDNHKNPKKEYEKARDKADFWELVNDIENYMNKEL